MPRKPSQKKIRAAQKAYEQWRQRTIPAVCRLTTPGAQTVLASWIDEIGVRIANGELGECTYALSRSVWSQIGHCRDGYYASAQLVGGGSTWKVA